MDAGGLYTPLPPAPATSTHTPSLSTKGPLGMWSKPEMLTAQCPTANIVLRMLSQLFRKDPGGAMKGSRERRESALACGPGRCRLEWLTS